MISLLLSGIPLLACLDRSSAMPDQLKRMKIS